MPSKSAKQRRFMAAAANNPKFARKAGIKQSIAKEFHNADKRKKYQRGGLAMMKDRYGGSIGPRRGGLAMASGAPSVRKPSAPGSGGYRPGMGALGRYGGPPALSGATRRPQQPRGVRNPVAGRVPGGNTPNGLLRTAQDAYRDPGNRLQSLMGRFRGSGRPQVFAKGGSTKKAIAALDKAREALEDSDPDFDLIADFVEKEIPVEGPQLAEDIRVASGAEMDPFDVDAMRDRWMDIQAKFRGLRAELEGGTSSAVSPEENFNEAIAVLNRMKREGTDVAEVYPSGARRYTQEYEAALKRAQELNPDPRTPIGFYLD